MARCRPGDLAVVIRAFNRGNVGRLVRVVGLHDGAGDLAMKHRTDTAIWQIESLAGRMTWSWPDGRRSRRLRGPAPDDQLQPIRGHAAGRRSARARRAVSAS